MFMDENNFNDQGNINNAPADVAMEDMGEGVGLICPDCENPLSKPESPEVGLVLVCENCGAELEIINTDPLEVDFLMIEK